MENQPPKHSIRTFSGKYFDFEQMDPDTICIDDIAHALAHIPRWTGHTAQPYSVGQHCIMAAFAVDSGYKLDALLHDATEAYMNDIARPLKSLLPDYKALEERLHGVIAEKFGLISPMPDAVKFQDWTLLWNEYDSVVTGPEAPYAWPASEVKRVFLELYENYKRV